MLGMADGWVVAGYVLCILSTVFCVIYGAVKWNSGDEDTTQQDRQWIEEEVKIEEKL